MGLPVKTDSENFLEYQGGIRRAQRSSESASQRTEISPCEYPSGICYLHQISYFHKNLCQYHCYLILCSSKFVPNVTRLAVGAVVLAIKGNIDFLGDSEGKASAYNAGDLGSISGLGRSPGEGNGTPLQYSCLENPIDGGAQQATVNGVAKSRTRLSDFPFPQQMESSVDGKDRKGYLFICVPRTSGRCGTSHMFKTCLLNKWSLASYS